MTVTSLYIADREQAEMRYWEISKEMSSLYFWLDVFCQFEARVSESDQCLVHNVHCTRGGAGGGRG
jgi:hypothetical protein